MALYIHDHDGAVTDAILYNCQRHVTILAYALATMVRRRGLNE